MKSVDDNLYEDNAPLRVVQVGIEQSGVMPIASLSIGRGAISDPII